ncbi:hypothetical protein ACFSQ7_10470 [Paenibacillus rhizoplanae]
MERADYYAREFRAGHPLKGFANEFRIMAERIFPCAQRTVSGAATAQCLE